MIHIVCTKCNLAIRTVGEFNEIQHLLAEKSEWYPDKYPCPAVECDGRAEYTESIAADAYQALDIHDLTPQEAFAAYYGLGLPEEQECGPLAVDKAFEQKVSKVNARLIRGSNRSVIDSIEFEDGSVMYLGSSAAGALVYRIAKRRSFVEEVLNEQV